MPGERVLIADDHAPTRMGVRSALEGNGFVVCADVADAESAVEAACRELPDLCLLDVRMPGGGVAAAAEISDRVPTAVVVMLTVSREDGDLFDALKAGARGYLLKDIDPDRLPNAVRAAIDGEVTLPRSLAGRVVEEFSGRQRRRRRALAGHEEVSLTDKEWEVLERLHEGQTTSEIADYLQVAPVTVRTHVAAVLRKLQVKSRADAVRLLDE